MIKINKKIKQLIEENALAFGTVDKSGNPNVIGVACVKVVAGNKILITDNYMKQTKENLHHNNNVCIAAWDKNWEGYKIVGTAKYFTTGKWKEYIEKMEDNKGLPAKGAILITILKLIKLG